MTGGGHSVGQETQLNVNISAAALGISHESVLSYLYSGGTMTNGWVNDCQLSSNAGTITYLYCYYPQIANNTGTIGTYAMVYCGTITYSSGVNALPNAEYCIQNQDPNQSIISSGPIQVQPGVYVRPSSSQGSLTNGGIGYQYLSPVSQPAAVGRYYYGIEPGPATGTISTLQTNTYWAPYRSGGQTSVSHVGIHILTGVSAATCSVELYSSFYGYPAGSAIAGPWSLSAATSNADVETTMSPPYLTINPGLYWFGVNCSSDSVTIAGQTEGALQTLSGVGSSSGADTSPYTSGTSFGTNPTISYASASNVVPQIWVRR